MNTFDSIDKAVKDIAAGKMIIVLDDEDRENEGDFVMAAEKVTPEAINFMASVGKGLICTPLVKERAEQLELNMMVNSNDSLHQTAFTVSVDSVHGGTGISAHDRSLTILEMVREDLKPQELLRPGHIFPLIAQEGGVLIRPGHTEAAVDFAKLAGLKPMGVICEIMKEDGSMARRDDLFEVAKQHSLLIVTIKDLIDYLKADHRTLEKTSVIDFPNKYGEFKMHMFEGENEHHFALSKGDIVDQENPCLVRVHSECLTGDVFGSKRCDCGEQLAQSMEMIEKAGRGVLVYLRQEGRGIGLPNKIRAYTLQDQGLDTVEANIKLGFKSDLREYGVAAEILKDLGLKRINLLTNNPDKLSKLKSHQIEIVERRALSIHANKSNFKYLQTKKDKMGHLLLDVDQPKCSIQ